MSYDEDISIADLAKEIRATFPGATDDPQVEKKLEGIIKSNSILDAQKSQRSRLTRIRDLLEKCKTPKSTLIVVDYQNDFIDGTLSLKTCPLKDNPDAILKNLNQLIDSFDMVVYTLDWHPEGHISFIEDASTRKLSPKSKLDLTSAKVADAVVFDVDGEDMEQMLWPRHCIQGSWGAELHQNLKIKPNSMMVKKGTDINVDSYSAIWNNQRKSKTTMADDLNEKGFTNVYVVGLAFDACVSFTAIDCIDEGFTATLVKDATCSITNELAAAAQSNLLTANCVISSTDKVLQDMNKGGPLSWDLVWQQLRRIN